MPQRPQVTRAVLTEIWRDEHGDDISKPSAGEPLVFQVQFNPETLRITYSTQRAGRGQPKASEEQYTTGAGTRLSMELWFDITRMDPSADVRDLTRQIAYFLEPQPISSAVKVPPLIHFQWGAFLFIGVLDSMDETLELFSEDGRALRARVTMQLSEKRRPDDPAGGGAASPGAGAGTSPLFSAQAGVSLPQIAASAGLSADWKGIAEANGIENPRILSAGAQLNLSAKVG